MCVKFFPINCIIFVVDFVENYNFQVQNEVPNMHWNSYQINTLMHITYQFNPNFDGYDENFRVGSTYYTKDLNQIGIMFGLMGVLAN